MACLVVMLLGLDFIAATIDGWFPGFGSFLQTHLGLSAHYDMMMRGVISLGDLTYFVGLTAVFLILNTMWLEGRKY